ncbi:unnamed protein product [Aphanomyces euteiches]|uniref:F-box domain-containing protein n=2 Tax=Aphanomyces euteiches TaxID=100861 RepID=A0A6G0X2T7_9STRA|nr:hypothetical protein Ae201684_009077 [Aphanomyces euteiches]KAH9073721.1 hypothetical protein Ae201684P_003224 [Aphanomyces euteiches]KAH9145100.1 hypothetical protein AeRB84_010962 [Aphanomyces euteiches]
MVKLLEDVVVKIAFFITEPDDLFAFLDALRSSKLIGPLEYLWKLSLSNKRSLLWPKLDLSRLDFKNPATPEWVEAIAKYYPCVSIAHAMDVGWLRRHVSPQARQEWSIISIPNSRQYWRNWSTLRITQLTILAKNVDYSGFLEALTHLDHLKSLHLSAIAETIRWMDRVLAFAATSAQLEELELITALDHDITASMLQDLIKWFNRRPVRVFRFCKWRWRVDDKVLKQTFYETMFNSPKLDRLKVAHTPLDDIDFSNMVMSVRYLHVEDCYLNSEQIGTLATSLERSSVQELILAIYGDPCIEGIQQLIRALPRMTIKSLELAIYYCTYVAWDDVVPLLESCKLTSLTLRGGRFDFRTAALLGEALRNNQTIRDITLTGRSLKYQDTRKFLDDVTTPKRSESIRHIHLEGIDVPSGDKDVLQQIAISRGAELHF